MIKSIFNLRMTSVLGLALAGNAIAQNVSTKNINRAPVELISIEVIESQKDDNMKWADLKVTARIPRWNRRKVENHPGILLGGKLSPYPGVLSYALPYQEGNRLYACPTRSDRDKNKCVFVARVDNAGFLDISQIDAYYTKVTRTLEERIFCSFIPICTPNGFDFISIEYSPK